MPRLTLILLTLLFALTHAEAQTRRWTTADGLPTDEVRLIIELPNGQMLVGCEGQFCLTMGECFVPISCSTQDTRELRPYAQGYGHLWEGDSLLWLHDFYRLYLFDARIRSFIPIPEHRLTEPSVKDFMESHRGMSNITPKAQHLVDSLGLRPQCTTAIYDRQGGLWIGTREGGIVYLSPKQAYPTTVHDEALMQHVRNYTDHRGRLWHAQDGGLLCEREGQVPLRFDSTQVAGLRFGKVGFVCELPGGRYLVGHDLNRLGYLYAEEYRFESLNDKHPKLGLHRNLVGGCPINKKWTVIYSQNGALMLDNEADTLAPFPPESDIEIYSNKYNCMVSDREGTLWIGTQNGLFFTENLCSPNVQGVKTTRISGLTNNCIRSLVVDAEGRVWAGTSCGISRITPQVVNFGMEDGIPRVSMMERAAMLRADSMLVFAHGSYCTMFRPEWVMGGGCMLPVQLLSIGVNGSNRTFTGEVPLTLKYDENYLTFCFSTLDYAHTLHARYRYRLKGLEQEWREAASTRGYAQAAYSALPPGEYTFEVQSSSDTTPWGQTISQRIVVHPPLWLTWWAKLVYGAMAGLIIVALLNLYLRRKRKMMEKENDERVNQLFERREQARHQFAENTHIDPTKIGINEEEEAFVTSLLGVIETHISDSEYGVDQLASDVGMSRTKLYDKMRTMLGISPADFIRNVRLKRAAHMLAHTTLTIAEVSERVGFGTARNFSTQFKRMFGMLPSGYRDTGGKISPSDAPTDYICHGDRL